VAFAVWERLGGRADPAAVILPPALARAPGFVSGTLVSTFWFGAALAQSAVVTLYLLETLHVPPLLVATVGLPSSAAATGPDTVADAGLRDVASLGWFPRVHGQARPAVPAGEGTKTKVITVRTDDLAIGRVVLHVAVDGLRDRGGGADELLAAADLDDELAAGQADSGVPADEINPTYPIDFIQPLSGRVKAGQIPCWTCPAQLAGWLSRASSTAVK